MKFLKKLWARFMIWWLNQELTDLIISYLCENITQLEYEKERSEILNKINKYKKELVC
jgi:hypothetical protein